MHSHVFTAMGTAVSIATPAPLPAGAADRVEQVFTELEDVFSLYRSPSEACRVNSGDLGFHEASLLYHRGHRLAQQWMKRTQGAFTPYRQDGTLDLAGVVKAMAIQQGAAQLHQVRDFCLNAGGDIVCRGSAALAGSAAGDPAPGWTAGIVHPTDRSSLVSRARLNRLLPALATSGTAERGEHVRRRVGGATDPQFIQVSVQAGDIITADALATSILSGGVPELRRACREHRLEVLAFARAGEVWSTGAFRTSMADCA